MLVLGFFFLRFHENPPTPQRKEKRKKEKKKKGGKKQGPFSVLFLSVTSIYISPHIRKLLRGRAKAVFGSWMSLNIARYPGDIRGKSSVIFPFGAGTRRCQVSRIFVFPLNPYGRLWLHVHDTWTYRGVFNHWSNGDAVIFNRRQAAVAPMNRSGRWDSFLCCVTLNYFCPPFFFLWELNIEIDSVVEAGWGKRLSRNPGNEEPWSSFPGRRNSTSAGSFHNKSRKDA